jgi:hypothetical protein
MIKNTWKHLGVGLLVGSVLGLIHWLCTRIPNTQMYLWWMFVIGFTILVGKWEYSQYKNSGMKASLYWKLRWLDTITDVLASFVGFFAGLLPFWWMSGF